MSSDHLADPRIEAFLHTKEVVVLAMARHDGAPAATPMWFLHEAGALYMISVDDTWKVKALHRDPRVSVVAETTDSDGDHADARIAVEGLDLPRIVDADHVERA